MADNFGLKIGLEGEKEFKKALADINQSFKVLGSEMKVVQSQFDKNDDSVEALTARKQVLGICVPCANTVTIITKSGEEITRTWENPSRSESWTPEMREKARQRSIIHGKKRSNDYSGD